MGNGAHGAGIALDARRADTMPARLAFRYRAISLETRRLLAWLTLWVVIANIGFSFLWLIGSPPRWSAIAFTGIAGGFVRGGSTALKRATFLGAVAYSVIAFVSDLFALSSVQIFSSLAMLPELRLTASPDYMLGAGLLVSLVGAGLWLAKLDTGFTKPRAALLAFGAVAAWAATDIAIARHDQGSYGRSFSGAASFESGVEISGFMAGANARRHLVLIHVEAMGLPLDPPLLARLLSRFREGRVGARYEVTHGASLFFGSTVTAEIRELCGRWGDQTALMKQADSSCLPARLRGMGYETTALHGFRRDFYDRATWYPHAGFQHMDFREDLLRQGVGACPGVFPGACDRDIPALITRRIKAAKRPQFIYWMTLNSHFPVPADEALGTSRCERFDPSLAAAAPMVCRMFQIWDRNFERLAEQIGAEGFPATDVLIVGDHRPPFYDRRQRAMFAPDRVPWILLRARPPARAISARPSS